MSREDLREQDSRWASRCSRMQYAEDRNRVEALKKENK